MTSTRTPAAARPTGTPPRRLPAIDRTQVLILAPLAVSALLVVDYLVAALRPATRGQIWLWTTATAAFPIWFLSALLFVAVFCTIWAGATSSIRPIVIDGALVVELGLYFFGMRISPPTGDQIGWWENAGAPNVALSEPLANIAQKIPFWTTHDLASVRYVAPVFGVVTILCFLVLARRLARMLDLPLWVFRAFVAACPLSFWYVTGYVENTFLALPAFFIGMERLLAFLETGRRPHLLQAAIAGALAALFHVEFMAMLVAFGAALLLRPEPLRQRFRDLGIAAGVAVLVAAAMFGSMLLLPVKLVAGNLVGGYDYQWFTPLELRPGDPLSRFTFFSHAHLIEVSNIVVQAAPAMVLILPFAAALTLRRSRRAALVRMLTPSRNRRAVMTVLSCCSIGYLIFIGLWGFDYGPVGDIDLMLVMSAGFGLYAVASLAELLRDRLGVLAILLILSGAVETAYYSVRIAHSWL